MSDLKGFMVRSDRENRLRTASDVSRHRIVQAVESALAGVNADHLARIAAAPTNLDVLALLVSAAAVEKPAGVPADPLAASLARGARIKAELLARAGEMFSGQQIAEKLAVSRQAVDQRRQKLRLLGLRQGDDWSYPAFQLADGDVLPGLPGVLKALDDASGWAALEFLLTPHPQLGDDTPLAVLACGMGVTAELARLLRQFESDGFA